MDSLNLWTLWKFSPFTPANEDHVHLCIYYSLQSTHPLEESSMWPLIPGLTSFISVLTGKVCTVLADHRGATDVFHGHRVCCQATVRGRPILLHNPSARTAEHKGEMIRWYNLFKFWSGAISEMIFCKVKTIMCLLQYNCSPLLYLKIMYLHCFACVASSTLFSGHRQLLNIVTFSYCLFYVVATVIKSILWLDVVLVTNQPSHEELCLYTLPIMANITHFLL